MSWAEKKKKWSKIEKNSILYNKWAEKFFMTNTWKQILELLL